MYVHGHCYVYTNMVISCMKWAKYTILQKVLEIKTSSAADPITVSHGLATDVLGIVYIVRRCNNNVRNKTDCIQETTIIFSDNKHMAYQRQHTDIANNTI